MLTLAVIAGFLMAETLIPTVTFCDLARNPAAYFNKTVRLHAIFEQHQEGQYLTDERCPPRHDDQIGVGYSEKDSARQDDVRRTRAQMQEPEYRGRAEVTIVGVLRNSSARHFYWYCALFEIDYFESARPAVALYSGELEVGRVYRAKAFRNAAGEIVIEPRLRLPIHHAGRIEWTYGPGADRSGTLHKNWVGEAVFRVLSRNVVAAGSGRWNTTVQCDLIRFE